VGEQRIETNPKPATLSNTPSTPSAPSNTPSNPLRNSGSVSARRASRELITPIRSLVSSETQTTIKTTSSVGIQTDPKSSHSIYTLQPSTSYSLSPQPQSTTPISPPPQQVSAPNFTPRDNSTQLYTSIPPRLSEAPSFYSTDYTQLSLSQITKLTKWILQLTSELALAKYAQQNSLTTVFFRILKYQTSPTNNVAQLISSFYYTCRLPVPPSVHELVAEVGKKAKVRETDISAIVRDGNILVAQDEDISPDVRLDVYVV